MTKANCARSLLAGAAIGGALLAASAAQADDLTWSFASTGVNRCTAGVPCTNPQLLAAETFSGANEDNNASTYVDDYSHITPYNYGQAFAWAESGEGDLSLPQLHASAFSQFVNATDPDTFSYSVARVQGVSGFTNTGENALLIPLSAFGGALDYQMFSPPNVSGTINVGLAITTDAILDPSVANQWSAYNATPGHLGMFSADCGTTGALAIANPSPTVRMGNTGPSSVGVQTTSCTGQDTFLLAPGESFFIWARLSVLHAGPGGVDAWNTFHVEFKPESVEAGAQLIASLSATDGTPLDKIGAPIPEPSAWALMILGFGTVGSLLRRRSVLAA